MEPVSIVLAGGIITAVAAHQGNKLVDRRRLTAAALPTVLGTEGSAVDGMLPLLSVHVGRISVPAHLAGRRIRVCVKYGEPHDSVKCLTDAVEVPQSGAHGEQQGDIEVPIGQTCLFLTQYGSSSVVRLRLLDADHFGRTLGKATLHFESAWMKMDRSVVPLMGGFRGSRQVAGLDVSMDMRVMLKRSLRRSLPKLDARVQPGAILIGSNSEHWPVPHRPSALARALSLVTSEEGSERLLPRWAASKMRRTF